MPSYTAPAAAKLVRECQTETRKSLVTARGGCHHASLLTDRCNAEKLLISDDGRGEPNRGCPLRSRTYMPVWAACFINNLLSGTLPSDTCHFFYIFFSHAFA